MKKSAVFLTLLLVFSMSLVLAQNQTEIDQAFECLEEKADDCSALTTQEIALTIMATPDNIFSDCVEELEDRESSDNWGNIIDTSLAIIALKHAGKNTIDYEEWLVAQNQTPTDLIWYLQQDSNQAVGCNIGYDANDYSINIDENKRIDKNAGSCLTRAQSNFWLQIGNNCYDKTFKVTCDQDFIANLIYRNRNSPTIYVLEGTESAPIYDSIELSVNSKCFGDTACDYEATAWATLALLETGHNVDEYIPYVIAMSETNERYLPTAFAYIMTNYEDYANALIVEQKLGNYWEAKSTNYNRYYDTGLALLALSGSTAEPITKAKDWLFFSQESNGCWKNSVRETAMILWALEGRAGKIGGTDPDDLTDVTYCSEANFFCIPSSECSGSQDVGNNYFCSSLSDTCCTDQNLKSCTEYSGQVCASDKICVGNSKQATDTNECCTGTCEERPQENSCIDNFYTCENTCSDLQEPLSAYSCDQGQTCCKTKTTSTEDGGSLWWIWVLIILILIVLGAIGYVYREQIKLYMFQLKTKFKKDDGKEKGPRGPGFPPRPGFPPIRRGPPHRRPMPVRQTAPSRRAAPQGRDKAMSDTFKKLQDMSK